MKQSRCIRRDSNGASCQQNPPWADLRRVATAFLSLGLLLPAGCAQQAFDEPTARLGAALEPGQLLLSDAEKRETILNVLERFVPHAESFWRSSDLAEPNTGRYAAVGSGVTQPRGAGDIAFAYVTLLAARPDQPSFGGVPREVMIDHTIQSIRHEAFTNVLSGKTYRRWGNGTWQASLEAFSWGFAAHRLWDRLDAETRALVEQVLTGEANILMTKPMASGEEGDTGAEDNAWNSPTPALAAIMFPAHPNRAAWESSVIRLALNASSTAADDASTVPIDGRPLGEWMSTVNLHPDLTMENHGFFNPIYQQVTHVDIGDTAVAYGEGAHSLPEALSFRTETIWTEILGRLATDDGDFAMPAGQDWTSKDFQHLAYLGILATRFQRADASVLESRALELVARRQATHASGSMLGQPEIGYETMLIKRLAALWWHHDLFGPSPQPSVAAFEQARAQANGVKQFPYSDFIAGRLSKAFASMSWDPSRPMALLIPHGEANLEDPIFSYYAPLNLLGSASGAVGAHTCACESDRFSTAGSVGTRRFSMTAFPDGTALLLDRGEGTTFTYALDDIPGLTGPRPIWSEAGSALGDLPGTWINAADRLGMVVRGGPGLRAQAVPGANSQIVITGATGTGSGNRGALLLPLANRDVTAALAPYVVQPSTPNDWSALSGRAADGSLRLAVARWGGPLSADLELSDERGAPVVQENAILEGTRARFRVALTAPSSAGQAVRTFVQAPRPLRGRQDGASDVILGNPNSTSVTARVTQVSADGSAVLVSRALSPGEEARARVVDGQLTLAGPELEPLLAVRAELAALEAKLESWCDARRRHGRCHEAEPVLERLRAALRAIDAATRDARAAKPNDEKIAQAIAKAAKALDELSCAADDRQLPRELRSLIATTVEAARSKLDSTLDEAFSVQSWMETVGAAQPGEPLVVRVHLVNRSGSAVHDGKVSITVPAGWRPVAPISAFRALAPGASLSLNITLTAAPAAVPGSTLLVRADLDYEVKRRQVRHRLAETSVFVAPIVELVPDTTRLRLAAGGVNQVQLHVVNYAARELTVTLQATAPEGAIAVPPTRAVTLPPLGSLDVPVALAGVARTTGTASLIASVTTNTLAVANTPIEILFTDDLAMNDVGAPWPHASATSNQPPYPPSLAFDNNSTTFWVSDGTAAGEGPSPTNPKMLNVDFGAPARIGSVTMIPRQNFGPRGYSVEVSDDGATWTEVAAEPNSPNATVTSTFPPVTTRLVRLRITGGYDRIQPPRNVQVSSFIVRAAAP